MPGFGRFHRPMPMPMPASASASANFWHRWNRHRHRSLQIIGIGIGIGTLRLQIIGIGIGIGTFNFIVMAMYCDDFKLFKVISSWCESVTFLNFQLLFICKGHKLIMKMVLWHRLLKLSNQTCLTWFLSINIKSWFEMYFYMPNVSI